MKIKNINCSCKECQTGEVIRWEVTSNGDDELYDCHWRIFKDNAEYWVIGWTDALAYEFKATEPGEYRMQCRLKDEKGNRSDYAKSAVVTVTKAPMGSEVQTDDVQELLTQACGLLEKAIEKL